MDSRVASTLALCRETAQRCERAADALGRTWAGWAPMLDLASRFRRRCEELVEGRQLDMETVAFIGPRKAGKSTLVRLLLRDEAVRERLNAGSSHKTSTEQLTWVGPRQPVGMDPAIEDYIPCSEAGMPTLGVTCTLADVPGDNEAAPARAHAAQRALDLAVVKVLVTRFTDRGNEEEVLKLAGRCGRSLILPVITHLRPDDDRNELRDYRARLARHAPEATILEPLLSEVFGHRGVAEGYEVAFGQELSNRLAAALAESSREPLVANLLAGEQERFLAEARALTELHLQSSAKAAQQLRDARDRVLGAAATGLLGSERELRAGLRWSFSVTLLERTPGWCFPWRPLLSAAVFGAGALDRLPLALAGSLPSLGTVIFQGIKNIKAGGEFRQSAEDGLRQRLGQELRDSLTEKFQALDDALTQELGISPEDASTGTRATFEVRGLGELQRRSTELFQHTIFGDEGKSFAGFAPTRWAAFVAAFCGFVLFWTFFGWPLAALYEKLAFGARAVWEGRADALALFPQNAGSMLITNAFLALLPMFIFLLIALSWLIRSRRVNDALARLRHGHQRLCDELIRKQVVRVEVSEPRFDACLTLLHHQTPPAKSVREI
jgi:hypothetical protein